MTEQEKITIFDALIKPFLRSDFLTSDIKEDNLFALAIRQLLNSSLRAQQYKHLGCERYERKSKRNGQRNGFKPRTIRPPTGQITLDVPQVRNAQTPFTPIIPGFERGSRINRL
ncbi:MAG: transposase [Akkermansia sp.]|nr:transposase [Akkermansia sp.]